MFASLHVEGTTGEERNKIFHINYDLDFNFMSLVLKRNRLYGPVLLMGFDCPKAAEPLRGVSLLLVTHCRGVLGTHLIDIGRTKC